MAADYTGVSSLCTTADSSTDVRIARTTGATSSQMGLPGAYVEAAPRPFSLFGPPGAANAVVDFSRELVSFSCASCSKPQLDVVRPRPVVWDI